MKRCNELMCNNEIDPGTVGKCNECDREWGFCPEHGGIKRAIHERRMHTHSATARTASCRWCDWRSEPYEPGNNWARDQAFDSQRVHVITEHAGEYRKMQQHFAERTHLIAH